MRRFLLFGVALAGAALVAAPAGALYEPPVDSPVVDKFRPPAEPWGSGNRGIDYAPGVDSPVRAAADGTVTFAGQVGGQLFVVVRHVDGIRTTYAYLRSIDVMVGQTVERGERIATAGVDLHFGARNDGGYIDPERLFAHLHAYLVPAEIPR